jgi:hypothetical protein
MIRAMLLIEMCRFFMDILLIPAEGPPGRSFYTKKGG